MKRCLPAGYEILLLLLMLAGCHACATPEGEQLDPSEWLPGGEATNTRIIGASAFLLPAPNLSPENSKGFYGGNGFFNQGWVEAPASTEARDGLGPFFNARSCSACHFRDGKADPPESGEGPFVGLLLRLSVPGDDGPIPHPSYGNQLQDQANPDFPPEGVPSVEWISEDGAYDDGTPYSLVRPEFTINNLRYGEMPEDLMISPRIAPHMIGLGLLEAIPASRLEELEDPDDEDENGVSGRVQWVDLRGKMVPGRFGWKAEAPDVEIQTAEALAGDMGLTSAVKPQDNCTSGQDDCLAAVNGGEPEVTEHIFNRMVLYSRAVAVPARRAANDPAVVRGKKIFYELECQACHTPSHVTVADAPVPEFSNQTIWPYTDLLLHDMGEGLADGRPSLGANGREWKTPPLWGLGLMKTAAGHTRYLHDGRARNLEEAILWHGGEAQRSQERFKALSLAQREDLLEFVGDL